MTLPTLLPRLESGEAIVAVIREALRFSMWAVGEGLSPMDGEDAADPTDFFLAYTKATGDEDWETVADRLAAIVKAKIGEVG